MRFPQLAVVLMCTGVHALSAAPVYQESFSGSGYSSGSSIPTGSNARWGAISNSVSQSSLVQADTGNLFNSGTNNTVGYFADTSNTNNAAFNAVTRPGPLGAIGTSGQVSLRFHEPDTAFRSGSGWLLRVGTSSSNSSTAFGLFLKGGVISAASGTGVNPGAVLGNYTLGTTHTLTLVYNNSTSPRSYSRSMESVPASKMDVWLDGVLVASDVAKCGGIATGTALSLLNLTCKTSSVPSSDFAGALYLDDIEFNSDLTFRAGYVWGNVPYGGGGAVTGICADPTTNGRFYMRTDVGGAYRWDAGATEWTPITEFLPADNMGNDFGIESLAVAPNTPGKLYIYTGKNYYKSRPGRLYKSLDAGDTWEALTTPTGLRAFANGNDHARRGEKLAVDPLNSDVVYLASVNMGLWRTVDGGTSWTRLSHGSSFFPAGQQGDTFLGLSFVAVDKSDGEVDDSEIGMSKNIYVGVLDATSANGGVWKSGDGGANWARLADPSSAGLWDKPARGVVANDGTLYVSYLGTGGVCKVVPDANALTLCRAGVEDMEYCGITVDPNDSENVYVAEYLGSYGNYVWRSDDGGESWERCSKSKPAVHYPGRASSQWFGRIAQLALKSGSSTELWQADWRGVLSTSNIIDGAQWQFRHANHEEIVPLCLRSAPSGAPLMSGSADVVGARHMDPWAMPYAGETFPQSSSPAYSSGAITSLDFCEADPDKWVRVGVGGAKVYQSTDNGVSWATFPTVPYSGAQGGRIAVSASDASNWVWLTDTGAVYYTEDSGHIWTQAVGAPSIVINNIFTKMKQPLTSNRSEEGTFYLVEPSGKTVKIHSSTDEGATWSELASISTGVSDPEAYKIISSPASADELWVGVAGGGVYRSSDGGDTFTTQSGMSGTLLAFGMSAPGGTTPALYFRGTRSGVEGAYHSDDYGTTWERIDNPGVPINNSIQVLEGDRQVYGRVYLGTGGRGIYLGEISTSAQ